MNAKKGKQKKPVDSTETSKLLAARISQLELDAAGEKDQEAEIDREVKKANRELTAQTAKLTDMQKIDFLHKRCTELFAEMKRHERESIKHKKRSDQVQKDKDVTRTELTKTTTLKDKLEKLCRELQKENNKLKNENKTLSDTLSRKELHWDEKYSTLLQKLEDYQDEKDNPQKQVVDLDKATLFRQRFKSFIDQYELRELHFHSQMRTKELEVQYNLARYEKEKETVEQEASKSRQLNTQVATFSKTEAELRQQLNVYVDKFKQVEDTLNNSNDLFLTFRKEMEDMSKKTRRLEKENEDLKRRRKALAGNISHMGMEREKYECQIKDLKNRETKLNGIIKQMQQQGRGIPQGLTGTVENGYGGGEGELEGDDSEYEDEYDEEGEEEGSADGGGEGEGEGEKDHGGGRGHGGGGGGGGSGSGSGSSSNNRNGDSDDDDNNNNNNNNSWPRRWKQISHNAEAVTENAAAGIWNLQHRYLTPCLAGVGAALDSCSAVCIGDREERARRARERDRGARRTRAEYMFDFYDDWDDDLNIEDGGGGGGGGGLLGTWGGARSEDWDRLLAGTGGGRGGRYAAGASAEHVVDHQPRRKRGMSYGTRAVRRKASAEAHLTMIPRTAPLGFLGRLPFNLGGTLRYKPSAANLRDHPGGAGAGAGASTRGHDAENEPLLAASQESPPSRSRSNTTGSGETSSSFRSRGDLFPSDEEGDEDAIPLDDEFAFALERVDDRSSYSNKTGSSHGKRPAADRAVSRTISRITLSSSTGTAESSSTPSEDRSPSLEDLKREEEEAEKQELEENERKRKAAAQLAQDRGLKRAQQSASSKGGGRSEDALVEVKDEGAALHAPVQPEASLIAHRSSSRSSSSSSSSDGGELATGAPGKAEEAGDGDAFIPARLPFFR
ncbi:hypothetical protein P8C59_007937 [Phyllachora maydis]|uniref:Uncharacterized protein n=1 Tax=Phyllachora maydis TaxID=1825666 RepID=A0AAD9I9Q2_9PEZI|nr:hypothetical protein P8C59_007937 [Phyllachora maydis]